MRVRTFPLVAILLALIIPVTAVSQNPAPPVWISKRAQTIKLAALFKSGNFTGDGGRLPYRYFEPKAEAGAKYPVVLYLHGEGEAGTDNSAQLTATQCATVWIEPDHLVENPAYVIAPQIAKGEQWTSASAYNGTLGLLQNFMASHPAADPDRVYIVGFSMGATGLYKMLLKNPQVFAAAMPISGSADASLGDKAAWAALRNTPVIIVHSYDDTVVPISAALNAAAALQAGGNQFLGFGAPTPSLWSPGSVSSPHDAWDTAFNKFEVLYYSLFLGNLSKTHNGTVDLTSLYTSKSMGDGVTQVWDYALGTSWVIERQDKAVIVDATMGHGSIYQYIRDHVLKNKDVPLEVFLTHQHEDHILGLKSFIGSSQLKKVYVHKDDSGPVKKLMGPDVAKVTLVGDGDLVPLGGSNVEVIGVPGHTAGSIVMKYGHYLFSGDSIGTGYIGAGYLPVELYIGSIQHLLEKMGGGHYTIYAGHTGELRGAMTEKYVTDLMACAKGIVAGTLPGPVYWRGRDSALRRVSTVGGSSITYGFINVHHIPGVLRGLAISKGILYPGYSPEFLPTTQNAPGFVPSTSYYSTWVDPSTKSLTITPTVLDLDDKGVTINGAAVASGQPYEAVLGGDRSPFAVTVTAADGTARTYTLTVIKGTP